MCIIIQKHYIHCIYFGTKPIKINRAHKAIQKIDRVYNYTELNRKYKLIETLQHLLAQSVFL